MSDFCLIFNVNIFAEDILIMKNSCMENLALYYKTDNIFINFTVECNLSNLLKY